MKRRRKEAPVNTDHRRRSQPDLELSQIDSHPLIVHLIVYSGLSMFTVEKLRNYSEIIVFWMFGKSAY